MTNSVQTCRNWSAFSSDTRFGHYCFMRWACEVIIKQDSGRPIGVGNGGSEGVAGREMGRGDVGESHRYSEEEKSTTYGKPDTKGSGPKLTLNDWKCNTCRYLWCHCKCSIKGGCGKPHLNLMHIKFMWRLPRPRCRSQPTSHKMAYRYLLLRAVMKSQARNSSITVCQIFLCKGVGF